MPITKVVIAALILAVAPTARADLTLSGGVGLPLNPTAQLPPSGGAQIQLNAFDLGGIGGLGDFKIYGLHGARRFGNCLEINGGIEKIGDYFESNGILGYGELSAPPAAGLGDPALVAGLEKLGFAFGAKYLLSRDTAPKKIRLAAGAGYSGALLNNTYAYIVGSKYLGTARSGRAPLIGHLGLRLDRFSLSSVPGLGSSTKASLYGGVEVPLTRSGHLAFVGELQSKNNNFSFAQVPYSAALRYRPGGGGLSGSIGVQRQGVFTGYTGVMLQVGYSFGSGGR